MPEPSIPKKPRIFLCHSKEDKPRVADLYHQLKEAGYHPWLDDEDLLLGQDWWTEIKKVIGNPYNLVVVCISDKSTTKRGAVQKEIKRALDVLDEMPEDTIYLIPARLEPCQAPDRLSRLHWVDLFEPEGFENLKGALDLELSKRQPSRQPFEPELTLIPAGEFLMGSEPDIDQDARDDERPQHTIYLPDYYMAKTPVTNAQYEVFVQATFQQPFGWQKGQPPEGKQDHPVVGVSWSDVVAYCNWLSECTGRFYRVPTEAEWEKGARGTDGRIYPWGNLWNADRCNSLEGGPFHTTPVGAYPDGASPNGLLDMAGNVWERCTTKWRKPYPYDVGEDEWSAEYLQQGVDRRVVRGGSFLDDCSLVRCAFRDWEFPGSWYRNVGFRVMVSSLSPPSGR